MAQSCDLLTAEAASVFDIKNTLEQELDQLRAGPTSRGLETCQQLLIDTKTAQDHFKSSYGSQIRNLLAKLLLNNPNASYQMVERQNRYLVDNFSIDDDLKVTYNGNFNEVSDTYFPSIIDTINGQIYYVNPQIKYTDLKKMGYFEIRVYDVAPELTHLTWASEIAQDDQSQMCAAIDLPALEYLYHLTLYTEAFTAPNLAYLGPETGPNSPQICKLTVRNDLMLPSLTTLRWPQFVAQNKTISLPKVLYLNGTAVFTCRALSLDSLTSTGAGGIYAHEAHKVNVPLLNRATNFSCLQATEINAPQLATIEYSLHIKALSTVDDFKKAFPKLRYIGMSVWTSSPEIAGYLKDQQKSGGIQGNFSIEFRES
ncbi:MAG TPA: hypothetical protein VD999_00230 [Vitreimonas sp.]|nr:hypothetical protein [Vitreimonas sp.]